jgi:cell division septation protein DedD
MPDERNRDFGGAPSRGPDQGAADRRDAGADALLELARLIGQSDPFAPDAAKSASMQPGAMPPGGVADGRLANVSRAVAAQATRDPLVPPPPPERSYEDRSRREPDFGEPRVPIQPARAEAGGGLDFLRLPDRDDYPVAPRHAADERDYDRGGPRQPAYGREDNPDEYRDGEYADGEYGMEPDDYDDDERPKRRRPTRLVMAVLGLAVFGGAAAYGYRTVFNPTPSGPTPIIRADNSPTKMTPMSDTKPEIGRLGDRIGEQVVPRAEEPVDVGAYRGNDAASQVPQDTTGGFPTGIMPTTAGAVAPPADTKRVHTVAISADSGTASRNQPRGGAAPAQASTAQGQTPPTRQVVASPPQPQPAAPPPQRQAALAPPDAAPVAVTVESGGYVVQLSAVRSEADAQTAFRQLQAKYPVLSGRQPLIRRKDQGDKGIFFAAQVGPFGAKSDADQLCGELKAAGGSCFVQRN